MGNVGLSITWAEYAQHVVGLFAIVNPFSTIPVFLGLTKRYSGPERKKTIRITAAATFTILVVAYFGGEYILKFFSIDIASFRIAAGILILMTAFSMINARPDHARQTDEEMGEARTKDNIAIVPLSLPLMAGPGSISIAIIASHKTQTVADSAAVIIAILAVALSIWLILNAGSKIAGVLGKTGMNVATRVMGLILAAIAIEFIVAGLSVKFPGWIVTG